MKLNCASSKLRNALQGAARRRAAAREHLLKICPSRWHERGQITYFASLNSRSDTLDAAAEEIGDTLEEAVLSLRPPVPALNRYTKLHAPVSWWAFAMGFFGLIVDAFVAVKDVQHELPHVIADVDAAGVVDEAVYRRTEQLRWRKASEFLCEPSTRVSMMLTAALIKFTNGFLGFLFKSSRLANVDEAANALAFVSSTTCPARRCIAHVFGHIVDVRDPVNETWAPFHAGEGLDDSVVSKIARAAWGVAGGIYIRCVAVWSEWPWPLGRLVHPDATPAIKEHVVASALRLKPCCVPRSDGFSLPYIRLHGSREAMLSESSTSLLRDTFQACPCTNLSTEDRFARHRRHVHACQGHTQTAPAVASQHALSEFRAMYASALMRSLGNTFLAL